MPILHPFKKFATTTLTKDLATVCMDVLRTDFHHVHLNGHDRLFREEFEFSKASTFFSERPSLTAEGTFDKLVPTFYFKQ